MSWIDWPVLARQAALIIVPLLLAQFKLPQALVDAISGPAVEIVSAIIVVAGSSLVAWVILIGQRREQPKAKIEAVANLPQVDGVVVADPALADAIPSSKVIP